MYLHLTLLLFGGVTHMRIYTISDGVNGAGKASFVGLLKELWAYLDSNEN